LLGTTFLLFTLPVLYDIYRDFFKWNDSFEKMKHIISIIVFAIISMVAKAQPCINSEANAA
jgi:hypothetical protein